MIEVTNNFGELPNGDLYSEIYNIAELFEDLDKGNNRRHGERIENISIATQNLRGFAKASRRKWQNGWRRKRERWPPDVILVQDTNLHSGNEIDEIKAQWQRMWQIVKPEQPLSYWSLTETKGAGMGILVTPSVSSRVKVWKRELWTSRIMAIEIDDWLVVNIYAPAQKEDRPQFFKDLEQWIQYHESIILGGDFNCVLRPSRDRITNRRPSTAPCESSIPQEMMDRYDMTDAVELHHDLEDDEEERDPMQFYTRWSQDGASRIDRFYVKGKPFIATQALIVMDAAHDSDHQEVRLVLSQGHKLSTSMASKVYYPIRSGRPQRTRENRETIESGLLPMLESFDEQGRPVTHWDELVASIQQLLLRVKRADRNQTNRYYKKLRNEAKIPRTSRKEIIQDRIQIAKSAATRSFGSRLSGSIDETRRFFRRNSEWQRDQSISTITASAGHFYGEDYPIEERMASEWSHVFGSSHAEQYRTHDIERFIRIPKNQCLTKMEAKGMMEAITEEETIQAIRHLKRHKTGGTTGLNHEFYKDFSYLLTPTLTKLFNSILGGAGWCPSGKMEIHPMRWTIAQ
ncbi:hypothetical protein PHMEG_00032693 [Phytophthora megakarya]|uniref:Endonuclease/exonuclease/phosphatase domain-containing protein n=1 Tax=Phytophthora megakarya TaxID=4795 RepID=A0A225UVK0_9STRA|nr:hypothetical protein PHMEG_00032693 [Phytophthora megakarya]